MLSRRIVVVSIVLAVVGLIATSTTKAEQGPRMYNTAKVKLMNGEQIVGGTVSTPDPDIYCAMADSGYDYIWIEMQHSPLSFSEVARMIWACKDAPSIPFIRVPNSNEGAIQKATDIGALGIIVPMVSDAEKVKEAVKYAFYPPTGERSQGGGQYRALWGNDYRQTVNDNLLIIAMIETLRGVENAAEIAAVEHLDVIFAAASDLGSFSGKRQGDPEYEQLVTTIRTETLGHNLKLGGPQAWMDRDGWTFFQGPGTGSLIRLGARTSLETQRSGTAQIEGTERR